MIPSDAPSEGIASPSLGPLIGRGRTAEIYAWGNGQVVKLFHTGWPEASIAYEERIAHLVKDLGLAAPRFFGRIQVGERIGLLYERIEGTSMLQALLRAPLHSQSQPGLPSQKASLARRIQDAPLLKQCR